MPYDQYPRERLVEFGKANLPSALAGKKAKAAAGHIEVLNLLTKASSKQKAVTVISKKYDISEAAARSRIYRALEWAEKNKPSQS